MILYHNGAISSNSHRKVVNPNVFSFFFGWIRIVFVCGFLFKGFVRLHIYLWKRWKYSLKFGILSMLR